MTGTRVPGLPCQYCLALETDRTHEALTGFGIHDVTGHLTGPSRLPLRAPCGRP